jgi:DNA-binding transcriptional regulator PaaX
MNDRQHNEKQKILRSNSRAAKLILEIGGLIEDTYFGLLRPGLVVKFGIEGAKDFLGRREINLRKQELKRLENRGLLVKEKINDWYWTSFSQAGFDEYIIQLSSRANTLPDDKMCIISFDIPEVHRRLRGRVRCLLKRLGFKQVHRSVWSCKKDVCFYVKKLFSSKFMLDNWFKVYITSMV